MSPVIRHQVPGHDDAGLQRLDGLVDGHGRALRQVGGAVRDLVVDQVRGVGQVGGDAHVHHGHRRPGLGGEGVGDGAAGQEVGDHLHRDLLRPRADAARVHAVVGGEDGQGRRLGHGRRADAGRARQAYRDLLQHAQRAAWLGEAVLVGAGLGERPRVGGTDLRQRLSEHGTSKS
jgi:hypothetical protein